MEPTNATPTEAEQRAERWRRFRSFVLNVRVLLPLIAALVAAVVAVVAPQWSPVVDQVQRAITVIPMDPIPGVCADPDHEHPDPQLEPPPSTIPDRSVPTPPAPDADDGIPGAVRSSWPSAPPLAGARSAVQGRSAPRYGLSPGFGARWTPSPTLAALAGAQRFHVTPHPGATSGRFPQPLDRPPLVAPRRRTPRSRT